MVSEGIIIEEFSGGRPKWISLTMWKPSSRLETLAFLSTKKPMQTESRNRTGEIKEIQSKKREEKKKARVGPKQKIKPEQAKRPLHPPPPPFNLCLDL